MLGAPTIMLGAPSNTQEVSRNENMERYIHVRRKKIMFGWEKKNEEIGREQSEGKKNHVWLRKKNEEIDF